MLEKLKKMLQAKEARKAELVNKAKVVEEVEELRSINEELDKLNDEIYELRDMITDAEKKEEEQEEQEEQEFRSGKPVNVTATGAFNPFATASIGFEDPEQTTRAQKQEEAEKRGNALREGRAVTVGSGEIVVPQYDAPDIRPIFNEVSGLIDRVSHKFLKGGESFKQPYVKGYGEADYTGEGEDYAEAEVQFGYAEINKSKVTAYAEDTEELLKLPAADYDAEVMEGVTIAIRKKVTRDILIGTGDTNRLVGIFSDRATAIDPNTDLSIGEITNTTLDEIIYSFGGDEDVEDPAVLILNKKDLKAFAQLRSVDGKKIHTIVTNGNTGTIDGVPFIINSACKAISDPATAEGEYCMAYGPLSNYMLTIFSDVDIQRSTDYKFREGLIAHRSSVFLGGNVVSKNGFLRVKKGETSIVDETPANGTQNNGSST